MIHLNEELIEQYALNAETMSDQTRAGIKAHLEDCLLCGQIYQYFSEFYSGYREKTVMPDSLINDFISSISPVIPLTPISRQKSSVQKMYMTVLAALTQTLTKDRFTSVAVLASEEHHAVVRILQDNTTNRYKIYVITDDPAKRSHAVLSFPEMSVDFVTDSRGQLEVDSPTVNWKSGKGLLRLAIAEHVLQGANLRITDDRKPLTLDVGLHSVMLAYVEENLQIITSKRKNYAPDVNVVVVSGESDETFFIPLKNGKGECSLPVLPESLTFRLYC